MIESKSSLSGEAVHESILNTEDILKQLADTTERDAREAEERCLRLMGSVAAKDES